MATKAKESSKNVVVLSNKRELIIKPTKLKYFSNGDFAMYQIFDKHGLENIIVTPDGKILGMKFFSAVMDKPYEIKQVNVAAEGEEPRYETQFVFDEELESIYDDEMSLAEFKQVVEVAKEVNGIAGKN